MQVVMSTCAKSARIHAAKSAIPTARVNSPSTTMEWTGDRRRRDCVENGGSYSRGGIPMEKARNQGGRGPMGWNISGYGVGVPGESIKATFHLTPPGRWYAQHGCRSQQVTRREDVDGS